MNSNMSLHEVIGKQPPIGVVDSGSTNTTINVQFLEHPTKTRLVGELVVMTFKQNDKWCHAFCQISGVRMQNPWHTDTAIQTLIRQRGRVDNVSEVQDVHLGSLDVNSVFYVTDDDVAPTGMGTVPPTGTQLHRANEEILERLFAKERHKISYLGYRLGTEEKMPFLLRHFGDASDGKGAGEAYHIGVFGKTGSGKSVLAKMLLIAYAMHRDMTIFVIDPQGEFSRAQDESGFSLSSILGKVKGDPKRVSNPNITQLALDEEDLFFRILKQETRFFDDLSIAASDNQDLAIDAIRKVLRKHKVPLEKLYEPDCFQKIRAEFQKEPFRQEIYRAPVSLQRFSLKVQNMLEDDWQVLYNYHWKRVANLFTRTNKKIPLNTLMQILFDRKKADDPAHVIIIDLSEKHVGQDVLWNSRIKDLVVGRLVSKLQGKGQEFYQINRNCNALVIVDEAHRLVPYGSVETDEGQQLKHSLIDAVRTTRKYGIGWMFISQTLGSMDPEIIRQMRITFFGFGLGFGGEGAAIASQIGADESSLNLYKSFTDPHAALDHKNRKYPFMSVGPVSPLAASSRPMFFEALDYRTEFMRHNKLG